MGYFFGDNTLRGKASADVAELSVIINEEIEPLKHEETNVINIATKRPLTITEFKQMFYARGDNHFCIAQVYDCPNNPDSILASVWGKRADDDHHNPHSRIINYNRLGGRNDKPNGVDLAYGYAVDLQKTFYAQFEIMGNWERSLNVKREKWTIASRNKIEDQLYALAFVPENHNDPNLKVVCARDWNEVEDALAESHHAEGNILDEGDYVDLYISIKVSNPHLKIKPTVIRIKYRVQLTREANDHGNWNIRSSDAAHSYLSQDIPQNEYRQQPFYPSFGGMFPPPGFPPY